MYKKILVPLDGSELAECVLPHVESIARGCSVPEIVFLRAVEPFRMPSGGEGGFSTEDIVRLDQKARMAAEDYLSELLNRTKYDGVTVRAEVLVGNAAESIISYAINNEIDLIAIATHGRSGISRWAFGSVADRVLRSTCVPVLMVRAPGCVPGI